MLQANQRAVAVWLFVCAGMIFAMVVLGGVTRLTRSGLSIVVWEPIRGTLPPLTKEQWDAEFARYKRSPEYQKVNRGMSLADFKSIFWMEYLHRLWGRLLGVVFLFPFLVFAWRGWIRGRLTWECALMFIGGGLQGLLGWYMVKSGLVNEPRVSQYRLVAHLCAAFVLYAYILWVALRLWYAAKDEASETIATPSSEEKEVAQNAQASGGKGRRQPTPSAREKDTALSDLSAHLTQTAGMVGLRRAAVGLTLLIFVMVLSGGFVAGLKGGLMYNTFPMMGAYWWPAGLFPSVGAIFESPATAQWVHRMMAYVVMIAVLAFWFVSLRHTVTPHFARARGVLLVVLMVQVSLGIATLLWYVPVALATLHQAGALCLFTASLYTTFMLSLCAKS
ncbi:COX15/CtaA family protein [Myxococcota bacterium]|nr:COX15/CtaA family protein [Myxococcota bacterium]